MNASNTIHLIGNLGTDPESKTLPSGSTVTEFSLATSDSYKDKDGNRVQRTEWHRAKAFGKLADVLAEYLSKGSKIAITGEMRYREWTDKYEQKRKSAEVVISTFSFLGGRPEEGNNERPANNNRAPDPSPQPAAAPAQTAVAPKSDLPF